MEGTPRLAGGAPDDPTVLTPALHRWIDLVRALAEHHAQYGVHGALRPQAFTGDPPAIDRAPGPAGADLSPGVLRYASPEVAGRIGTPDARSDLYSIGAIGFELLAGAPPFTATDRAALAYDHLATPAPALDVTAGVPAQLAAIVAVLLRKSPAERYASAASLLADLERCLADWAATGSIAAFAPDTHGPPRFAPTDELYGRAAHLAALEQALDRAAVGPAVVVMISGAPGSGKSALLHALRSIVTARQARFVLGRFDRAIGARPYAGIRDTGEALMRQLLTRPDAEIDEFRRRVIDVLGERVGVLTDLVPGIAKLTGSAPAIGEATPGAEAHWFHASVADFAALIATPATPMVSALDDLQWADQASLDVLAAVAERHTTGGLLIVGTYRPDDVGPTSQLTEILARLRLVPGQLIELQLDPLSVDDVAALADDACGGALVDATGLAEVVCAKSGGNPLHVQQLLRDLVADGDLAPTADGWRWHPRVRSRTVTENVVDLTARRIGALPAASQRALAATALAGRTFTLGVAAAATGAAPDDVLSALAAVLHDGILEPIEHADEQTFMFAHERLRQVALELETGRPAAQIHLAIARHLHADRDSIERAAHLFATVDHYAAAVDVIEPEERSAVAGLAMLAGGLAYSTLAHAAADAYFTLARRMLRWDTDQAAKWRASAAAALALSIRNRHDEFAELVDEMRRHAPGRFERVRTATIEAVHLTRARQLAASMRVASAGLIECGLDVPFGDADAVERATAAHLATFRAAVAGRDLVEVLSALPRLDDDVAVPLDLIAAVTDAAAMGDTCFANLLAAAGAVYCLEHGSSRRAALVYTLLAQCLIDREQAYGDAAALIEAARRLDAGQLHDPWMTGRMASTRAAFVDHWLRPVDEVLDAIPTQITDGASVHDPMYAAYQLAVVPVLQAVLGRSLATVLADHQRVVEHCRSHSIEFIAALSAPAAAYAEALMGRTESITSLDGSALRVEAFLADVARDLPIACCQLRTFEIALHGLVGNYAEVLDRAADQTFTQVPPQATTLPTAQWVGTAAARQAAGAAGPARRALLDELASRTEFVRRAFERGEQANSAHRLAILNAETALVEGHPARAFELFGEAAAFARRYGWLIDEGYARAQQAQLAARVGRPDYAVQLLYADAEGCWRTAGALALVRWIRPLAEVVRAERTAAADPTPGVLDSLDTEVVVRAVQLLTADAGSDGLCARLLGLAIDASGAERGAVVGMGDGELRVVAASPNLSGVPTDLIRLTLRSGRAQHIRPRTDDAEFSADDEAALGGRRPAALLCVPVGWAGEPSRVLYLEHAELDRVFTGARRNVVGWLAGHTGIVLGHAELYSALEHEVMVRTRELTEAKEAAERATAAKSEFLAHMSHEVRTPMNAVLGLAEILQSTELDDFQREQLSRLDRAGRLLMGILSDVLDFSRIEAGELDLAEVPFDLAEVVRDIVGVVSRDAAARGVALVTDLADDVPRHLVGDPVRLGQVLLNLLANAIKFTLHGSVELHIGLAPGTPSSGEPTVTELRWLRAEVRDTGRGIAAADLERIFEPFQQVHRPSFHPNRSGSGLGLPISRHVARRMGGDLTVTSRLGAGSVFTLEWPARLDRRAAPAPAAPAPPPVATAPDLSGRRILVVEDNDINREILRHMLAPLNVQVVEAANGAEAVTLAAQQAFDLVLMDCQMPVVDGYEATRALRNSGSQVPIVGVSAHVSVDDRQRAIDAGMNDYLTKPIDVKLLQATVESWFAG